MPTATRTATPMNTPTPTRSGPFVATPDGPLIFDFPTPRPVGSPGPISGLGLSALAVVKVQGCARAGASDCEASEGTGAIIHPRGLILTALHVVVENPNDLRSSLLPEVSIGMVTDMDTLSAVPTYRASVAAIDVDLDMALLWIIPPADQPDLRLPTLPVESISYREFRAAPLQVMGFPQGELDLKESAVDYYGVKEGAVEVQAPLVGRGFSGSPLLVERDGRHHIGGVVFFRSSGPVLVQPVRRLDSFRWGMVVQRLWVEDAQSMPANVGALHGLNLTVNIHAVDLAQRELQLIAVAYDPQGQPWPSVDEQLTLQRNFEPARFVDVVPLRLSKPLAGLGRVPERLRFVLQVWDMEQSELLWEEAVYYLHSSESPIATSTPMITPSIEPIATSTPTRRATATNTATSTAAPIPIAPVIDLESVVETFYPTAGPPITENRLIDDLDDYIFPTPAPIADFAAVGAVVSDPILPDGLESTWEVEWACGSARCAISKCNATITATADSPDQQYLQVDHVLVWDDTCYPDDNWKFEVDRYSGSERTGDFVNNFLYSYWVGGEPGEANGVYRYDDSQGIAVWCSKPSDVEIEEGDGWTSIYEGSTCHDVKTGALVLLEYTKRWFFTGEYDGTTYNRSYFGDSETLQQRLVDTNIEMAFMEPVEE